MTQHHGSGRSGAGWILLLALLALPGCGPITTTLAMQDAEAAVALARTVEAEKYALYEITLADAYLRKAREEEGDSCFQVAINLAGIAKDKAEQAYSRALKNPQRGQLPRLVPGKSGRPADDSDLGPSGSHL